MLRQSDPACADPLANGPHRAGLGVDAARPGPIGFAHRGARAHAPENTIEAFVLALRMGAAAIESDVWLTKDGEVVLDHDGLVEMPNGKRRIRELTRAELPRHIPTIGDFYAACGTGADISLDLKDPAVLEPLLAAAAAAGPDALQRLWLCDPDPVRAATMARAGHGVNVVASLRVDRVRGRSGPLLAQLASAGVAALNLRGPNWTRGLVRSCHAVGLAAFAWGLQSPSAIRRAVRMGADAVYSDHVDHMMRVLSEAPEA